ncbi:E3 ubiquitin-protein ligase RGLG3 [Glycine soja]
MIPLPETLVSDSLCVTKMGRKRASKNTHRALVLPTVVKPQPSNVRRSERIKSKSLVVSHPNTNCDIEVIEYITLSDGEKDEADTQLEHESELADNLGEKKSLEQKINCALQRIDALNKAVELLKSKLFYKWTRILPFVKPHLGACILTHKRSFVSELYMSIKSITLEGERKTLSMGNEESTHDSHDDFFRQPRSHDGSSPNTSHQYHQPPSYDGSSANTSHQYHQPSSYAGSSVNTRHQYKQRPTYIADSFSSLDQVVSALREAGLESSNLIIGIDFTKSNEWTGKHSFNHKSLHFTGNTPNPYEQAISIIGRTLSSFDEDNLIPCFGFGDASTHDQNVFSFYPDECYCHGFEQVLARYREIVPHLKLAGPTSFAPVIDAAVGIVERSNGQYHVLVIIADGQVTRNSDTPHGKFSPQEQATINSIIAASHYPLSIILVGVGDGPWDEMQHFDDNITQRLFDNFQFVNFTKITSENKDASKKEAAFALAALMEIPIQYRITQNLQIANENPTSHQRKRPLPPPKEVIDRDNAVLAVPHVPNFESVEPSAPAAVESVCPICLTNPKDMAFGCGHTTCKECGVTLSSCPMCRQEITTRLRLYT